MAFFLKPSVLAASHGYQIEDGSKESSERGNAMKHKLKVSVSKEPKTGGIAAVRKVSVRERLLRVLLGEMHRVVVLIPGDKVDEIAISEEAQTEFLMPPLLTDAEIEDILAVLPDLHLEIMFPVFWHSLFRNE